MEFLDPYFVCSLYAYLQLHTYNCMQLQFFTATACTAKYIIQLQLQFDIHNLLLKLKSPTTQKLHLKELFMVTITTASKGIKQARKISQPTSKRPNMAKY